MNPDTEDFKPFTIEEAGEVESWNMPGEPNFPILIFLVAVFKDFIDIVSGGFLGWLTSLIAGIVIWFWTLGKTNIVEKRLMRWFIRRFIIRMLLDALPIVGMWPFATTLILAAHHREKKLVKLFYEALGKINPLVGRM